MLLCSITVIAFHFISKTEVKGKMLSQTESKYYVDFSEDLKKNKWELFEGRDGKQIVDKSVCIEILK